jgi:hypothetical protein
MPEVINAKGVPATHPYRTVDSGSHEKKTNDAERRSSMKALGCNLTYA